LLKIITIYILSALILIRLRRQTLKKLTSSSISS